MLGSTFQKKRLTDEDYTRIESERAARDFRRRQMEESLKNANELIGSAQETINNISKELKYDITTNESFEKKLDEIEIPERSIPKTIDKTSLSDFTLLGILSSMVKDNTIGSTEDAFDKLKEIVKSGTSQDTISKLYNSMIEEIPEFEEIVMKERKEKEKERASLSIQYKDNLEFNDANALERS